MILLNLAVASSGTALADSPRSIDSLRSLRVKQLAGPAVYAVTAICAWKMPMVALSLTILVWIWWLISLAKEP